MIQGNGTILLVDDEDMVREAGVNILEYLGYTVLTADNGKTAIDIFKKQTSPVDLVILDLIMPDMGGGEVFDRLLRIDPNVAVLISSGYSIDSKADDILNRGGRGFIQKPYTINELSEKLNEIMTDNKKNRIRKV